MLREASRRRVGEKLVRKKPVTAGVNFLSAFFPELVSVIALRQTHFWLVVFDLDGGAGIALRIQQHHFDSREALPHRVT